MRFPIIGFGQKGKSPNISAQNRVNCYLDIQPQEDKAQFTLHRRPGYELFYNFGNTAIRGMTGFDSKLYVVHRSTFYEVTTAGVATSKGTIATSTGRVGMDVNRAGEVMIVDGNTAYQYVGGTLADIVDADVEDTATTVAHHDGFFLIEEAGTGIFHINAIDDITTWDGDTATAEKSADDLVRVVDNTTEIILMGEESMEFWSNTGATDFPYERYAGGVIEMGLAAKWSVARYGESSIMCLARSRGQNEVHVIRIDGLGHVIVSNPEMSEIFNGYTTSDASAFSYSHQGHQFYQINFPTDAKSWMYDGSTNLWSMVSYGANDARDRGEHAFTLDGVTYVADYENGNLYKIDRDRYDDNGEPIVVEFTSRHIFDEKFVRISRLWLDIESGVGTAAGAGVDPTVLLQISRDGGHTWGNEKEASIGAIGEYTKRAIFRRLGRSYDWVFRVRVTDPVKTNIVGAWVDVAA